MSPVVLALMYIMGIAAWPTAKLLDYLLGEDHGTVYKKTGLKTLVTLHQSLGNTEERLNQDEEHVDASGAIGGARARTRGGDGAHGRSHS